LGLPSLKCPLQLRIAGWEYWHSNSCQVSGSRRLASMWGKKARKPRGSSCTYSWGVNQRNELRLTLRDFVQGESKAYNRELGSFLIRSWTYLKQSKKDSRPEGTVKNNGDFDSKQIKQATS
jgi:hypothetical protein